MEKRIELEKRGNPAAQIKDLNLDNCRSTQIEGLTDEFTNLVSISLIGCGLTMLKGFPNLPNLRKLELSDNRISSGLNFLHGCPKLTSINLSGNKIKDIATLEPLKELSELRILDLFNCDVTSIDNYREKVFELLTGLEYLDGFNKENEEVDEDGDDDEEGDEEDDDDSLDEEEELNRLTAKQAFKKALNESDGLDVDDSDDDDDDDEDDDEDEEDEHAVGEEDSDDDEEDDGEGLGDEDDDDDSEAEELAVEQGTKRKREDDEDDKS